MKKSMSALMLLLVVGMSLNSSFAAAGDGFGLCALATAVMTPIVAKGATEVRAREYGFKPATAAQDGSAQWKVFELHLAPSETLYTNQMRAAVGKNAASLGEEYFARGALRNFADALYPAAAFTAGFCAAGVGLDDSRISNKKAREASDPDTVTAPSVKPGPSGHM